MRRTNLPASFLQPLAKLHTEVKEFAALCEPDHLCQLPDLLTELKFHVIDGEDHDSAIGGEHIALRIKQKDYLFTEHSRKQLLDHLGTREKWFKHVTIDEQARELTRRIHVLKRQKLRIMGSYEALGIVRGLVSARYVDIPDLEIMDALISIMPDGQCLEAVSGKSDKAFYVYAIETGTTLGLGNNVTGHPGALIKNSEVGAGALWVMPYFLVRDGSRVYPVAIRRDALLRRVHRGQYADLKLALETALKDLQSVWAPLQKRLDALLQRSFASEQEALERLQAILKSMKRPQGFIDKVTTTYSGAKNTAHNGLTLFMALLAACATKELDQRYDDAEVAGYLLLQLV